VADPGFDLGGGDVDFVNREGGAPLALDPLVIGFTA